MNWSNAMSEIVARYSGQGGGTAAAPETAHEDFQRVAQAAPDSVVADGITQAFRSDRTPPFAETAKLPTSDLLRPIVQLHH